VCYHLQNETLNSSTIIEEKIMNKSKTIFTIILSCLLLFVLIADHQTEGCTTAIISPSASLHGVPMLWKNRDTGFLSNKVIYVTEKPFSYIGLVNAAETSGRMVYAGLNNQGFGIMNSVAYNLPKDETELMDLEGQIMADALRTCRTADDFENYIKKNLGAALGSWANFGVIDANGEAVIFEVHNNGYKRLNAASPAKKYFINSNFSRSGKEGKGAGYLRFEQATKLFDTLKGEKVSHPWIFQQVARQFGHPLVNHPSIEELQKQSKSQPIWLGTQDCISRKSTASAVVIIGRKPGDKNSLATFWVMLGEPVTSIAVPLWVEAKTTPEALYKGKDSPLNSETLRIKKIIRPHSVGSKANYMKATGLVNKEGTGFLPLLMKTEQEIFQATDKFLKVKRTGAELAKFQDLMTQKALETLKKIKQ
jgi:hypothetical protein